MSRFAPPLAAETMTHRQRWLALTMLAGSLLVVMMDMTILIMALPGLIEDLEPSASQQLWIVDIYSLILAGLLIPMSALADRFGRKRMLLIGFALFGVVSVLVLFATSAAFVIGLRALLGAAGAMIMPTTLSMIRTIFHDPTERARALAIWSVISGLGVIIGPLLGGLLLQFFSWHSAFLVNVPFVIAAIAFGVVLLPEGRDPNPPRWDVVATVLSIAGMVLLVWGIKQLGEYGWGNPVAWIMVGAAAILLTLFVRRCLSRPDPLLEVRLFRSKPFTAGAIAALTASLAMAALILLVAQWLQAVAGFTPVVAGVAVLPMAIGSLIAAPFAPNLAIRFGARNILAGGLVLAGAGLLLLFATGGPTSYLQLIAPLFLVGAGTGSLAIASAIIMGSTPTAKAGSAAAIEESMYDIGNVLGVAILGSLSAALYRDHLAIGQFAEQGITGELAHSAEESIVGALTVAEQRGLPALADAATAAFGDGIAQAALVGGLLLVAAAVTVFTLVPRRFDIAAHNH
ncbi:MFS transporter [Microbacterium sp. X-17]|uniref:MFS transporter n=1 Tax=Microbacterium sp. X-17 TaxID=3144404 RepID=UPI0031F572B5